MSRRFVDTSAWVAYANDKDPAYGAVARALDDPDAVLVTSSYVFAETVTWTLNRRGHAAARRLGRALRDPDRVFLETVSPTDEEAAWNLFEDRPDKRHSITDCTSFVLMRRLGIREAVALDDDFTQEGFDVLPA